MSGQCLSPSELGHALTPSTHRRLGRPLPHQQANRTRTHPRTESHLWSVDIIRYYLQFPVAIPNPGAGDPRVTLPFAAFHFPEGKLLARLACLIHAANVHSEPGSNPSKICLNQKLTSPPGFRRIPTAGQHGRRPVMLLTKNKERFNLCVPFRSKNGDCDPLAKTHRLTFSTMLSKIW